MKRVLLVVAVSLALATVPTFIGRNVDAERVLYMGWEQMPFSQSHVENDVKELETILDNPSIMIDAGWIQSANVFGDQFRQISSDAETWRVLAPVVPACIDSGTQTISATDTGGVDAGNGALIFNHGVGAQTSTRVTSAYVSGADRVFFNYKWRSNDWNTGNFTVVLTSVSSNSTLHWCGGYNAVAGQYGGGIYNTASASLKTVQAFTLSPSGLTLCGASVLVGNDEEQTIMRTGTQWSFKLSGGAYPVYRYCYGSTAPLYGTFDFVSGGSSVVMIDEYDNRAFQNTNGQNMANTYKSSFTANWTWPSTAGPTSERITQIEVNADKCPDAGAVNRPSIGWFALISASDWTVLYQPLEWTGYYVIPNDLAYYRTLDIDPSVLPDGPYRFQFSASSETFNCFRLLSVIIHLTFNVPPPPPPPPEPDEPSTMTWLSTFVGASVCGVIGFAFIMTLFVVARKLRRSKGE